MDLWITLIALYAWQCTAWLPRGSALLVARRPRRSRLRVAGRRLLPPWPSGLALVLERWPFELDDAGRLRADAPLGRHGRLGDDPERIAPLDPPPEVGVRGTRVTLDGRPFAAASSPGKARLWAGWIRALAAQPAAVRLRLAAEHLDRSLDERAFAARLAESRRATRWLGWLCDAQALWLLVLLPAVGGVLGAERALWLGAPAAGALHLATLAVAVRAHRRLFPDGRAGSGEDWLGAALYPPALLRLPQRWLDEALAGFHPLAAARALWPDADWREACATEWAWLERRARRAPETARWNAAQREALRRASGVAGRLALEEGRLPRDPTAAGFCPLCRDEFRAGFGACRECELEIVAYPGPFPGADPAAVRDAAGDPGAPAAGPCAGDRGGPRDDLGDDPRNAPAAAAS